jgi:hypothetical protein
VTNEYGWVKKTDHKAQGTANNQQQSSWIHWDGLIEKTHPQWHLIDWMMGKLEPEPPIFFMVKINLMVLYMMRFFQNSGKSMKIHEP